MNRYLFENIQRVLSWSISLLSLAIAALCLIAAPLTSWSLWLSLLTIAIAVCPRVRLSAQVKFTAVAVAYFLLFIA
jgi:hypothetical protein